MKAIKVTNLFTHLDKMRRKSIEKIKQNPYYIFYENGIQKAEQILMEMLTLEDPSMSTTHKKIMNIVRKVTEKNVATSVSSYHTFFWIFWT